MTRREGIAVLAQWLALGSVVGVICGAASASFLLLLDVATRFRGGHENLVYALPLAGLVLGWFLARHGRAIVSGSNLVIDTIHDDGPKLPLRMAPMVLVGTVLTHLFGGSAGREGTAVQMGASLADGVSHRLGAARSLRRQLLVAGVAGGFGSVFGTPVAGAVFALEFSVLGRLEYDALVPALVASLVGDLTARGLGAAHLLYPQPAALPVTPLLLLQWLAFAALLALATTLFIELTHVLRREGERRLPQLPLRMCLGGLLVVLLWKLVGTSDYLGLGLSTILRAFEDPALPVWGFAAKILFTAITLGAGFPGGEVTPLFFVGATLGAVLAQLLGLPLALGAGVGMTACFAAAANTPLALSIMAVELLGANVLPHVAIVCVLTYLLTGHRGIYPAQRVLRGKGGRPFVPPGALRDRTGAWCSARAGGLRTGVILCAALALPGCAKQTADWRADLAGDDSYARVLAVVALGESGDPEVLPDLWRAAGDPDPDVAREARAALARLASQAVPQLLDALAGKGDADKSDAGQRNQAVAEAMLIDMGAPAVPPVAAALRDGTRHARAPLARTLARMGPPGVLALTELLASPDAELATLAARALALSGKAGAAAIPALKAALARPEPGLSAAAAAALEALAAH